MPGDWFAGAASFAREPQTWAFVLNLVLVLVIDRRLFRIVQALERNTQEVVHFAEHNTSRMQEIRDALYRLVGLRIPPPDRVERRRSGGSHGHEDSIPRPE